MYLSKLHKLKISIAYLIVLLLSTKITVLEKSFLLKHISKCGRQTVHIHYIFLWWWFLWCFLEKNFFSQDPKDEDRLDQPVERKGKILPSCKKFPLKTGCDIYLASWDKGWTFHSWSNSEKLFRNIHFIHKLNVVLKKINISTNNFFKISNSPWQHIEVWIQKGAIPAHRKSKLQ